MSTGRARGRGRAQRDDRQDPAQARRQGEIAEDRLWLAEKPVEFEIGGNSAVVTVEYAYGGLAARSKMHLDGRYVEPLVG